MSAPYQAIMAPPMAEVRKGGPADRVEISTRAHEMQAAMEAVKQMPDVDMDKVAKVKAMLENGTYKTDADKTAAKMLAESLIKDR